ncbi:flagellar basal body rod protein [Bacillus cereus]|uniref:Flagellar basal body rod protein n=1 Tax=Bacillus thuringiensis TaxID=1428 RepID=A0A9X6V8Y4_BACTU|nr:flagellar basal body rod protein [Bacillus thuringiensis]MCU5278397.1 flagellar basal body rod protein [Bacillus cereus]MEC3272336.1 flagellar basal body rod protein [Bacillus thuringiensis]MED2065151.1 flagellar basal body rod protein [Bacillus thuringiensis]PFA97808.1 flagellar basal body rod protein [Bacillus thuringiensis]
MKQFLAFIAAGILALIALGSLAGIVGFAIGAGVVYWSYKSFVRAKSFLGKLAWGIVGLIGLSIALSHSPALIGIAALVVLYYGYREWKKEKDVVVESAPESSKPYSNFEDEWNKLMKN